ncbi:MAG: SDR family NAD(P)-dependent oxidoreductase, partial [Synechococcaceae cyanobacterium SM2_3_1]|nr:SDR family NAD(P)-dependent oxidoreductase [Synechococcaceae cyanobacterium SM2_3_1]
MSQNSGVGDYKSLMETALIKLEKLQSKLAAVEQQYTEPIAIIGMGCRFPAAPDPQSCWRLLSQAEDAIREVPPGRWDLSRYYDPDPAAPGKTYTRAGGFLDGIDRFDPAFFGISPREALTLDPQQRLLLEVSWQALEQAGMAPETLERSLTGVFIGISSHDYSDYLGGQMIVGGDLSQIDAYVGTGNTHSVAAGRISYFLGTQGPSLAVDTACSSSLVALHLACQSLRQKECHLALAGGVNVLLSPAVTVNFSKAHMLSADGRCKTFDAAADGYGRSEGCGVVLLKRLSDAQRDGDPILALIRGSAVNQDGPSGGLTVPNGPAQEAVIRQALANGKVDPALVDYIEAHGTGTALGDPIELGALGSVFASSHNHSEHPLWVGSIKTNIGHSEAAAGIAGLIKVILALQHEQMPAHLHFQTPNPHIPWDELPLQVVQESQVWPRGEKPRVAGISSFGFSGTNAHVVIQEAPAAAPRLSSKVEHPLHLLTLSAKTPEALKDLAHKYVAFLRHTELDLGDICLTANTGRSHFIHRMTMVAEDLEGMAAALQEGLTGSETSLVTSGRVQGSPPRIAFLFTGQGSQYVGMGRKLYETQPTFKRVLDQCAQILDAYLDQPLLKVLFSSEDASPIDQTAYTQPALFALEYSLAQVWISWGIQPQILMGHSVGEYVAACIAGVFSLEDGLKLIAERARLMQALSSEGAMVSVLADPETVEAAIAGYPDQVAIAAYNGLESVVFSGERQAVKAVATALESRGIKVKQLEVSQGFHSPLMDPILKQFEQIARQIKFAAPQIPIISNVTGELARQKIATPEYWVNHVRQPVKFAQGMQALQQQGVGIYLEVGPKPILLGMGRQCLTEDQGVWLPSLRPGQSDWAQILQSLSHLYVSGIRIDWSAFYKGYGCRKLMDLPTYPFQRQRFWIDLPSSQVRQADISPQPQTKSTQITQLLDQGALDQLTQLLQPSYLSLEGQQALPEILQALIRQHQSQQQVDRLADWFYQIEWQPQPSISTAANADPKTWLIFADRVGVGQILALRLQTHGHTCVVIHPGESLQKLAVDTYQINPALTSDFERFFQEMAATITQPCCIVHLWNLDIPSPSSDPLDPPDWEALMRMGCGSVLNLVKALQRTSLAGSTRLWLVSSGSQPVGTRSDVQVGQTPLWGLGRVIASEFPFQWGGLLDLDPDNDPQLSATQMLTELTAHDLQEDQLAYRDQTRYVARLVRSAFNPPSTSPDLDLKADATYLITGGLGSLGLSLARQLVQWGARHLLLLGRRSPSVEAQREIDSLTQQGVEVVVAQADATRLQDLQAIFTRIESSLPPICGIIHAAGVLKDGTLQQLEWSDFWQVLAPKVAGSWNLHQLSQDLPLDFCVWFSSVAALMGSAGQGNYAAANAFMDGLSSYRHQQGLASLSINWGAWSTAGMAANL